MASSSSGTSAIIQSLPPSPTTLAQSEKRMAIHEALATIMLNAHAQIIENERLANVRSTFLSAAKANNAGCIRAIRYSSDYRNIREEDVDTAFAQASFCGGFRVLIFLIHERRWSKMIKMSTIETFLSSAEYMLEQHLVIDESSMRATLEIIWASDRYNEEP